MADNFDVHAWKFAQLIKEDIKFEDYAEALKEQAYDAAYSAVEDVALAALQREDYDQNDVDALTNKLMADLNSRSDIENLNEEDDRCTRIAKRKYDVWPSAYASGAVVRCRKGEIWKDEK